MTVILRRLAPEEWAAVAKPARVSKVDRQRRLENQRRYNAAHPEKVNAHTRRLQATNPEMFRVARNARARVHKAVVRGILVRPENCSRCGLAGRQIEGAHHDYTKPLEVMWLCSSCHRLEDRRRPKTQEIVAA